MTTITPWLPVLAAYIFGVATGWLLWGNRKARTEDLDGIAISDRERPSAGTSTAASSVSAQSASSRTDKDAANTDKGSDDHKDTRLEPFSAGDDHGDLGDDSLDVGAKIAELDKRLKEARVLLDGAKNEQTDFAQDLSILDTAINRANVRLKNIINSAR